MTSRRSTHIEGSQSPLSIQDMILEDRLESQFPTTHAQEWLLQYGMSPFLAPPTCEFSFISTSDDVYLIAYLVSGLEDPYTGQLIAPTLPVIGMAGPVLQQVQNLGELADTPYGKSHNSMNTTVHTRKTRPKRQRNQKLIVSPRQ
jgi:hypothetical protein